MEGPSFLNDNVLYEAEDDLPATQIVDDRVLKGVVAYVEVRSTNDNRSEAVRRELTLLGATVVKKFTSDVTHVVFKEGSNRTKTKAQKKGIHLVSVLWVENCKLNQEHVSERMYPAFVPRLKGTPLLMTKLKKAKSMQPRDFEEELASSAERVGRKRKKLDAINRLKSTNTTPSSSPRPTILVQDTQPRSPDDGFVLTPVRLTIPDTPPSMRERMRKIREAKEDAASPSSAGELDDDMEEKHVHLKQLQKKLFKSTTESGDNMSSTQSPNTSSVFMTDTDHEETVEEELGIRNKTDSKDNRNLDHDVCIGSESSVNDDIFKLAQNINATLSNQMDKGGYRSGIFGVDSDENLLNSQEIKTVVNVPVKLKQPSEKEVNVDKETKKMDNMDNRSKSETNVKNTSPKRNSTVQTEETAQDKNGRRRSSRRLSVQQAVKELDKTTSLDVLTENDEDENPIPELQVYKNKHENKKVNTKKEKATKKGRNSMGKLRETKQDGKRVDRSNMFHDNSKTLSENEMEVKSVPENDAVEGEKRKVDSSKATDSKKTLKKKLMSLTDLTEQHSVLIEPTKCSSVERPLLEPTKVKKGRKKKLPRADSSYDGVDIGSDAKKDMLDTGINTMYDTDRTEQNKRGKTSKNSRKRKSNESGVDAKCASTRKKRSTVQGENEQSKAKKGKKTLVNETHVENDVSKTQKGCTDKSPVAKIQDVTTQLNLTKDNDLVCSIRETTLSLSMSTAYTDVNMPSFLISQRKSIDEFNASQRLNKSQKLKDRSVLTSIIEKENSSDLCTSDSDGTLNAGKKRGKVSSSQHRKIVRPSIVMTSLHSYEQDVVISVVKKLGGFVIAENVNETTTHVICGESRRTLNVLQCLARGLWLLTKEWVIKSLEAGEWIPEGEFECASSFPACKKARLDQEKTPGLYRQTLFTRIGPVYISGRSQPPRQHLVQLLRLCGGQVIGVREKASIYFGSDYHPGMTCVKTNWLLDCITSQKLLAMDKYYLDRPKRESSPAY